MTFSLVMDRSAEIRIDALIKITADEPPAAGPQVTLSATFGGVTSTHTGATKMSYTLPADKRVELRIAYTDANNNPAKVDGAVEWDSSDEDIARCEPFSVQPVDAPQNGAVMLVPGSKVGNCQISATADADLGSGVRHLVTLLDVTVVAGEAVQGTITPHGEQQPLPDGT